MEIVTDTSTIAIFDLKALEHRVDEDGDWWTSDMFPELQEELKNHNLILINTRYDGTFSISVSFDSEMNDPILLNCPSKKVYVVCGEEIPGEGLTPSFIRGGTLIDVTAEKIQVSYNVEGGNVNVAIKA